MSGSNKSYLPSQRMMPTYTTVPSQLEEREPSPDFPYDPEASPEGGGSGGGGSTMDSRQSPMGGMAAYGGGGGGNGSGSQGARVSEQSLAVAAAAAYGRQGFPYGLSGVAMPTYNYGSELYNYVSNGFPRKSRMCTYCNKIFTRSTTRRYHEKRCPLLRAAGSLMNASNADLAQEKGLGLSPSSSAATVSSVITAAYANPGAPTSSYADYPSQVPLSTSSTATASPAGDPSPNSSSFPGAGGTKSELRDFSDSSSNLSGSRQDQPRYHADSKAAVSAMFSPLHEGSNGSPGGMVTENISDGGSLENEDSGLVKPIVGGFVNGSDGSLAASSAQQQRTGERPERSPPYVGGIQPKSSPGGSAPGLMGGGESPPTAFRVKKEVDDGLREAGEVSTPYQNDLLSDGPAQARSKMQGPYPCRFCGEGFFKESSRAAHERIHSAGDKPYVCVLCEDSFSTKATVREHMAATHREGPFHCKYCKTTLAELAAFKTHLETHDLPKAERDSTYYLGSSSAGAKDADSPEPDAEDDDSNTGSSMDTEEKEEVNGEMEAAPEAEESMDEPKAEGAAEAPASYGGVVNGSSSRDKMWCQICKQEISRSLWRFHERVHADEKPYECTICHKRFGYKNNMKSHMKLHAGIKPYQCHICGAKFTRGSTLRRHARRHGFRAETVYEMYLGKQRMFKPPDHPPQLTLASVQAAQNVRPSTDSEAVTSRSATLDAAVKAVGDGSMGYDLSRYTSHSSPVAPYLQGAYPTSSSLSQPMYPGLPSTTASLLQYGSSYGAVAQAEQSDALNLSINSKSTSLSHGVPMSLQDEDLGGGPPRHSYRMGAESEGHATPRHSPPEPGLRQGMSSSPERMTPQQEMGGAGVFQTPLSTSSSAGFLGPQRSFGVQVNLCCGGGGGSKGSGILGSGSGGAGGGGGFGGSSDLRMMSPSGSDGSGSIATSPGLTNAGADPRDLEPLMALVGAKKLFRCELCECYFADYPMYRIHQKLHIGSRPFQCPVCSEDCHDRVYFSIHVYDHLR